MNTMDNRSLIAIVLCILLYLGWSQYMQKKYPKVEPQKSGQVSPPAPGTAQPAPGTAGQAGTAASPAAPGAAAQPGAPAAAPIVQLPPEQLRLDTDVATFQFSQAVAGLASVELKNYKRDIAPGSPPQDVLDGPLALQGTIDPKAMSAASGVFYAERHDRNVKFWRDTPEFKIAEEWTVPQTGYTADLKVTFTNVSGKPQDLTAGLLVSGFIKPKRATKVLGIIPGSQRQRDSVIYDADNSLEWLDVEKFCSGDKEPPHFDGVPVKLMGFDRHYFISVLEPKAKQGSLRMNHGKLDEDGCALQLLTFDRQGMIKPNETTTLEFTSFFGPKDLPVLAAQGSELEDTMHFGTLGIISRPLLAVIEGFEKVFHNYGIAIIVLTICLKGLFYPLVRASSISMHKMKKLNPQMQAIREKWKDDRQRQQTELMSFMQKNKINPMKGCFPVIPQIPVFWAFYTMLQNAIALHHAPFFGWIQDLSAPDPFYITPVLMGVAMFAQQKLTPTTGMDKTQEKILMFMPIMFTVFMLTLPAGLTLYMLTNTLVGITQQKLLYRKLDKLGA